MILFFGTSSSLNYTLCLKKAPHYCDDNFVKPWTIIIFLLLKRLLIFNKAIYV